MNRPQVNVVSDEQVSNERGPNEHVSSELVSSERGLRRTSLK